jgi:serine/threonine-protein kinase
VTSSGALDLGGEALADRYAIQRELGRGGMATVYLAQDLRHNRLVALKLLHADLAGALGLDRFLREIGIAARLQHPHILPLFDSGSVTDRVGGTRPFYAMPYISGESLRARLNREKQLAIEDAVRIARDVAAALSYAHEQGVVHRDIKPENILLNGDQALVADFGIAKALDAAGGERLTETGLSLGTPAYMSPEQATAGSVDPRTDIYSLGCVLYEMLAGDPPFVGSTPRAVMARHAIDPVPSLITARPGVPPPLEAAIRRALAKVPADRFSTAADFAGALTAPMPPAASARAGRLRLSGRRGVMALVATLVAALGIVGLERWRSPARADVNPSLVAVLPFQVASADPELAWLREGMVDLLAIKLMGDTGLRAVEPRAVLSAWQGSRASVADTISRDAALRLARRLGAGRAVQGRIVGSSARVILSAAVLNPREEDAGVGATIEGPMDSLPVLVDRLATRLLGLDAGIEHDRLSNLTSNSLPAVRAFLAGRAEFRRGHVEEATPKLYEATELDSTFALAALELAIASSWSNYEKGESRGLRLAWLYRDRLNSADHTLLELQRGQWSSGPDMFRKWQAAVSAYPDRPGVWYGLGDTYFHWGMLVGIDSALQRAAEAFRRGWQLDSSTALESSAPERSPVFAEPLTHMVDLAQLEGDTAEVRRLVRLGLAADTSGEQAHYLKWHLAVAQGDSARQAFWENSTGARGLPGRLISFAHHTGIAVDDGEKALAEDAAGATGEYAGFLQHLDGVIERNRGRAYERGAVEEIPGWPDRNELRLRILYALYWDGDTALAADAARRLARFADAPPAKGAAVRDQYFDICTVSQWRLSGGDTGGAEEAIERLQRAAIPGANPRDSAAFARYVELCAATLSALQMSAPAHAESRARLVRLDSLARTHIFQVCCGNAVQGANLVVARLAEYHGDLPLALRAVRRRASGFGLAVFFMSTFAREEGRLAALTGDTVGAIRAYQHYLALRRNARPSLRPEVDRVRAELAKLLGEPGERGD